MHSPLIALFLKETSMENTAPNKKQKISLADKYALYLNEGPKPGNKLSNKYNLFDDLNIRDNTMMKDARDYLLSVKSDNKQIVSQK